MKNLSLFQHNDQYLDWMSRAREAREEFDRLDSSQIPERELWTRVARKNGLTEDLKKFMLLWEVQTPKDLFDLASKEKTLKIYLIKQEIEKTPKDFLKLKRAWGPFSQEYQRRNKRVGEEEVLHKAWLFFWDDPSIKEEKKNFSIPNLGKRKTKEEMKKFVQRYGIEDVRDYWEIIKNQIFLQQIEEKQRVSNIIY